METLLVEREAGIVTVTMNRPHKKNAANGLMFEELLEIFREVERNPDDRCMVLTGAGGDFCTGADLSDASGPAMDLSQPGIVRMRRLGEVAMALHQITKPTIARVDGLAVGAGLSMAIGCDLIIASDRARFSMIFARRGLSPDMGASWLLPRQVGMAIAKELILLGDIIDAPTALSKGLVNRVVPLDELDGVIAEVAARLGSGPTIALSLAKTLLNNAFATSMSQALEDEGRAQSINFESEDTAEAIGAFLSKRSPNFKGR
ncbi:MAG: enoyl-CoA hydratase [Actinomycetes bacterium]